MTISLRDLSAGRKTPLADPNRSSHIVQFYDAEEYLFALVADFVGDGLSSGEPAVVIATNAHCDGFSAALATKGIDVDAAVSSGQLRFLDARETLSAFMDGSMPNADRFMSVVGGLITRCATAHCSRVRAYGEMVDLLWRDGNPEGAIRLEELWNDLGALYSFSLLCAYPMGNFYKESDASLFEEVCRTHGFVMPTEAIGNAAGEAAKAMEISILQQRAEALRHEVEHRKELERALRDALAARRAAEEDLKDFVENAPIAMHWVGPDGTILWANEAELKLLGYTADEYVGRNITELHADRDVIDDILNRLLGNEELKEYEARLVAKDGSIRHVSISSNAFFTNGEFVHTRCFTTDITDRKRLEEERRKGTENHEFLLEASTILNRSLDFETRLRDVANLAVPRLADWCAVDIARDGGHDRVSVAHGDPSTPLTSRAVPDEETILQVLRSGDADLRSDAGEGSRMIVPMKIGERVLGAITFVAGPSRHYSDADLLLATELARRAGIAIENARLYQLAQQANRTKDEFLATLSHELRTPLTAILGWARMLSLGGLDKETSNIALDTIERSARTQATLIDDLLDLSKVVTGKLTLQSELVDLASVVTNAVQTLRLAAEGKGIQIEVSGCERTAVVGDPTRLQQITWNLLSNAIKFSDTGGKVSIALERAADSACIVVHDTGRGIAPDFLPHVFEPFRQADSANTRMHGGLGLGLAIVKYLTELHGGTASAHSDGIGKGATFVITLPLALRRSMQVEVSTREEIADLHGMSILLVDDDPDTRDLVEAILRRCGAEVSSVDSVRAACESLEVALPHVLVTDISMPEQDGYELLHYLRSRNGSSTGIPVVALTALGYPEAEQRLSAAGFRAYIRKPIEPLQFARAIADLRPR